MKRGAVFQPCMGWCWWSIMSLGRRSKWPLCTYCEGWWCCWEEEKEEFCSSLVSILVHKWERKMSLDGVWVGIPWLVGQWNKDGWFLFFILSLTMMMSRENKWKWDFVCWYIFFGRKMVLDWWWWPNGGWRRKMDC